MRDRATLLACLVALASVLFGCASPDRVRMCAPPSVMSSRVAAYQEQHGGVYLVKAAVCMEWR